jgi:hypothetical protein
MYLLMAQKWMLYVHYFSESIEYSTFCQYNYADEITEDEAGET